MDILPSAGLEVAIPALKRSQTALLPGWTFRTCRCLTCRDTPQKGNAFSDQCSSVSRICSVLFIPMYFIMRYFHKVFETKVVWGLSAYSSSSTLMKFLSFYWVSVANAPNILQPYWLIVLPLDVPALTASLLL